MFFKYLLVGEILAYSRIDLIQQPQFNGLLLVDLDVPSSLDSPLQSTGYDCQVFPLFFIVQKLIEDHRKSLGVSLSILG